MVKMAYRTKLDIVTELSNITSDYFKLLDLKKSQLYFITMVQLNEEIVIRRSQRIRLIHELNNVINMETSLLERGAFGR